MILGHVTTKGRLYCARCSEGRQDLDRPIQGAPHCADLCELCGLPLWLPAPGDLEGVGCCYEHRIRDRTYQDVQAYARDYRANARTMSAADLVAWAIEQIAGISRSRAQFLIDTPERFGEIRKAYRARCDSATKQIYPDGMTEVERAAIVRVWDRIESGSSCFMDALRQIANGGTHG